MANLLPMTKKEAIRALQKRGYSQRKIARELGIHRDTVGNYLTEPPDESKCTTPTAGSEAIGSGRKSACEPYRELIESKLASGLQGMRIWQDLVTERGFNHGYESVKRFVRKLKARDPQLVHRMECEPGEEVQVDYGTVWSRIGGKKRKMHVLRVTLSHSRKGYTEAMPRQDTESFVRGLENAFRHFGGVPQLLVLDNLKAGVLKPDYYDPQLNPKFASFCKHYGVTALPTRPRTPEHKGKVESNIRYVKESAMKGKEFATLAELNQHLREWERTIADRRIHGTTRKQVGAHFNDVERPSLQPLPADLFASFVEGKRRVHRDSHVEFDRAYYDVPAEYIGRELWVRYDGNLVRLFNLEMEPIAIHAKLEAGRFTRVLGCGGSSTTVEQSLKEWTRKAAEIGTETGLWAKGLVETREAAGLRVLMGLINQLLPRYGKTGVERACAQARLHGQYRLRDLKHWLEQPGEQQAFSFLSEHEIIRDLADYGKIAGFEQGN